MMISWHLCPLHTGQFPNFICCCLWLWKQSLYEWANSAACCGSGCQTNRYTVPEMLHIDFEIYRFSVKSNSLSLSPSTVKDVKDVKVSLFHRRIASVTWKTSNPWSKSPTFAGYSGFRFASLASRLIKKIVVCSAASRKLTNIQGMAACRTITSTSLFRLSAGTKWRVTFWSGQLDGSYIFHTVRWYFDLRSSHLWRGVTEWWWQFISNRFSARLVQAGMALIFSPAIANHIYIAMEAHGKVLNIYWSFLWIPRLLTVIWA